MKANQLKAGVILSYISEIILILTSLIYTPIMLRLLGQSEYGLYQLSSSVISYLSLLSFGLGSAYIRYYSRLKVKDDTEGIAKLNGMFMVIFIAIGLICVLAGSVLIGKVDFIFDKSLTKSEIDTARTLMIFMVFNLSISFPGSVFSSYITANEQYVFQRIVNILKNLFNPFLTLPLLLMGYKSVSVVCIQTVLAVSALVANLVFCKNKIKMEFSFKNFDWKLLREMFVFSFWIFLNEIIDQVNWNVDKFILGVCSGTIAVAVYGIGSQINALYLTFSTSISNVFIPRVNRMIADEESDENLTQLFTRIGRIQFIVLYLIVSGFVIFGKYFINLWAGNGYEDAYTIILLLIVPVTIPLIQNIGIEIQKAKNKHQFRSIVYIIIALLNVAVSIPLTMLYGGIGAAAGTAMSLLIGNGLIMNIFYHKKIRLDMFYFWKEIFRFIPALIIPVIVGTVTMKFVCFDNIIKYLLCICLYVLVYGISMWIWGMNTSEKNVIRVPLKKIIGRRG